MSSEFFPKLSQNYIELLESEKYYDIEIEVGEDSSAQIFHAHMNVLYYRSPYLRRVLDSTPSNNDNVTPVKLPKILPDIFQVILK